MRRMSYWVLSIGSFGNILIGDRRKESDDIDKFSCYYNGKKFFELQKDDYNEAIGMPFLKK